MTFLEECDCNIVGKFDVPDGETAIPLRAFQGCLSLAFAGTEKLDCAGVALPADTRVTSNAFNSTDDCPHLSPSVVPSPASPSPSPSPSLDSDSSYRSWKNATIVVATLLCTLVLVNVGVLCLIIRHSRQGSQQRLVELLDVGAKGSVDEDGSASLEASTESSKV